ncbi:MAG: hypothetical protein QOF94_998 [Acidobacteriaceae bacterium]|jgi:hypothetical protein
MRTASAECDEVRRENSSMSLGHCPSEGDRSTAEGLRIREALTPLRMTVRL